MISGKKIHWRKLDNAAKIFPAVSNRKDTRVFRFYCECIDTVDGAALQEALYKTLDKYPLFQTVLRKGLFWYYMEKSSLTPVVREEYEPPCLNLYHRDKKNLLFQVTYYKNRINFEVFHALTDGTGAIQFLKELVKHYLILRYPEAALPDISLTEPDLTTHDQETDSFSKYYNRHPNKEGEKKKRSYQLTGARTGYGDMNITEGVVSCKVILKKAKEYGVSLTVLLTSVLMWAIYEEMTLRRKKKPVVLMIPVNLRNYFPSFSMLNFWGWIEPDFSFADRDCTFEEVIAHVQDYFKRELTKEGLEQRVSQYMKLERNPLLRLFPLEFKNLGMQLAVQLAKPEVTAVFSNLGVVKLPEEYAPYLKRFGVFTSTQKVELSTCSYQDDLVISIASGFQNQNIERNFFRLLKKLGIESALLTGQFPEKKKPVYEGLKFFQWFSFACIAAACICVMVNIIFTPHIRWSAFVIGGAFSMWVALALGFFKRHNLLKNGIWQMLILPLVCVTWDLCTGWHAWSVDYVMPCIIFTVQISILIITKLQKLSVEDYMIYHILAGLIGLIPGILVLLGVAHFYLFCVLCSGISFLWLMALLIFRGKDLFTELYKKLHF